MNYPITFSFIFLKLESRKHLFIHSNEDAAKRSMINFSDLISPNIE